jgi:hypothetical protein
MDIGSLLLILGVLVLVGVFLARPFLEHSGTLVSQQEKQLSALLAERERLLNALEELDFDHSLGKIPAEDYPAQRAGLLHKGANVLRELDELRAAPGIKGNNGDLEARLEAAINSRRSERQAPSPAGRKPPPQTNPDDELEALIAHRRRDRNEKAAGFCPKCGGPVQKSDRFCPKCGATVD